LRNFKYTPFLLSIIMLVISITVVSDKKEVIRTNTQATTNEIAQDIRGVWVSYITLDMQNTDKSEDAFTNKINSIITKSKENGFNTLVFQVRPFCDALYESTCYPWSHILTGTQSKAPKYDPLKIICDLCHKNDISVHAWINPYRVKTEQTPKELSDNNPYSQDKSIGFEYNNCIYLDPSNEKAQKLIVNGVKEIVKNYDVDGIQFDDYFYPENCDNFDDEKYQTYKKNTDNSISKEVWRAQNVNNLIKDVYNTVHKYRDDVVFGISPQGNINNNIALGADVKTWCQNKGYIDYICPQIYFSLDNPSLTFEESLNDWLELDINKNINIYIGLAGYKGGSDEDEGTWLDNNDILKTQIEIVEKHKLDGIMLFSYESFLDETNQAEIENVANYLTGITQ